MSSHCGLPAVNVSSRLTTLWHISVAVRNCDERMTSLSRSSPNCSCSILRVPTLHLYRAPKRRLPAARYARRHTGLRETCPEVGRPCPGLRRLRVASTVSICERKAEDYGLALT